MTVQTCIAYTLDALDALSLNHQMMTVIALLLQGHSSQQQQQQ